MNNGNKHSPRIVHDHVFFTCLATENEDKKISRKIERLNSNESCPSDIQLVQFN